MKDIARKYGVERGTIEWIIRNSKSLLDKYREDNKLVGDYEIIEVDKSKLDKNKYNKGCYILGA